MREQIEWLLVLDSLRNDEIESTDATKLGDAVKLWTQGRYDEVVRACSVVQKFESVWKSCQPSNSIASAIVEGLANELSPEGRSTYLLAATGALQTFLQANLTGPPREWPDDPVRAGHPLSGDDAVRQAGLGEERTSQQDRWALTQLIANGEEIEGKCSLPQYLALARLILLSPLGLQNLGQEQRHATSRELLKEGLERALSTLPGTWAWWTVRLLTVHQRLLSGLSHSLREVLRILVPRVVEDVRSCKAIPLDLKPQALALVHLEASAMEQMYGDVAESSAHLTAAKQAIGFDAELSGALGLRTVHQADAKAQLVVSTRRTSSSTTVRGEDAALLDAAAAGERTTEEAVSDVLESVRLADSDDAGRAQLDCLEQAVLLALAEQQKRASARDELQPWQVAAFADAVLAQSKTLFTLRCTAKLFRVRFERSRTRTRERALLAMEQMVDAAQAEHPPAAARMRFAFASMLPLRAELRKELGEQLIANGMVGAAMQIFEQLELWDSLLICYRLLEKTAQALALVRSRLEADPGNGPLLCALGDLTRDPQHYEEAWEKSGRRNARAQRSLARCAMAEGKFGEAAVHWDLALRINPLHPEGWFALGFCCLKSHDTQRAVRALTRCTQQQPDNGEAWNNIAAVHLQDGRFKEAYSALQEAVKFKRDSWQTWSNLAAAAVKTQNYQPAARAVEQVGQLTQWQRQDTQVLQELVRVIVEARERTGTAGKPSPGQERSGDRLLERSVQGSLKAAANATAVSPGTWGLIAALNQALGYPDSARDALKKQVRSLAGSSWQRDRQQFREYAAAVVGSAEFALAQAAQDVGPARRDLASSRLLLQSVLKSANTEFRDEQVFDRVERALEAVRSQEQQG